MSNYEYKSVLKVDNKNRFRARFNGNTGFYIRTGILESLDNSGGIGSGCFVKDTGVEPFMACFPELIDIGIMEQCVCRSKCKVDCYQKACDRTGKNMPLEDFKWIMQQCRAKTFQVALGGAGAVSEHFANYTDKAVELLIKAGVKTNIHYVLSTKTVDTAINILNGVIDYRPGINAIVFLLYKPVGLGKAEYVLKADDEKVRKFFHALDNRKVKFKIGFDSCSCSGLINFVSNYDKNSIDFWSFFHL